MVFVLCLVFSSVPSIPSGASQLDGAGCWLDVQFQQFLVSDSLIRGSGSFMKGYMISLRLQ